MSNTVFLLKKGFNKEDIPKSTIHLMVSHNYDKFLNDIPDTINELTIFTTNKLFYCNMPNGIKIININLVTLRDYNIILDNLPISLEKIRVNDYSKYTEFEFLEKNIEDYSIELRRRYNLLSIIKNNIIKKPFGCIITNKYNEELVDLLDTE
jgi:hypothetical protein